jgi:putative methionine-R-sulfoxide reductase with GAF domain
MEENDGLAGFSHGVLNRQYKTYKRQRCFVGHSHEAAWRDDIVSACAEVLPRFDLEPWYAADHFDPTQPLRDKVVELIANARYGLYDLSDWQEAGGEWHLPRNVFIELGIAIALNRPTLLLRHTSNAQRPFPKCLGGIDVLEFAGETTLKRALEERLPSWVSVPPERDWLNRFCIFGNRVCSYREEHPKARQWGREALHCHVSEGAGPPNDTSQQAERDEIRGAIEGVLSRYRDLAFSYLDELAVAEGYQFLLCSYCQTVRSAQFAIYRVGANAPAELFIAMGINIALEALFEYKIPKVLIVRKEADLPSLLRAYDAVEAINTPEIKRKLAAYLPHVIRIVREVTWKPRRLPFTESAPAVTNIVERPSDQLTKVLAEVDAALERGDRAGALASAAQGSRRLTGASFAGVFLLSGDGDHLVLSAASGDTAGEVPGARQPIGRGAAGPTGIVGRAVIQKTAVIVDDVASYPDYLEVRRATRSEMAVPILLGDELIGVLDVESEAVASFSNEHHFAALRSLAERIAHGIRTPTDGPLVDRVAEVLSSRGWSLERLGAGDDARIDLVVALPATEGGSGKRVGVRVEGRDALVGWDVIRAAAQSASNQNLDGLAVVSRVGFGRKALGEAQRIQVSLLTLEQIESGLEGFRIPTLKFSLPSPQVDSPRSKDTRAHDLAKELKVGPRRGKIRLYDLAKELKLDNKRVIDDARREGISVSVPSHTIPLDVAERIRQKYYPTAREKPVGPPRLVKTSRGRTMASGTPPQPSPPEPILRVPGREPAQQGEVHVRKLRLSRTPATAPQGNEPAAEHVGPAGTAEQTRNPAPPDQEIRANPRHSDG